MPTRKEILKRLNRPRNSKWREKPLAERSTLKLITMFWRQKMEIKNLVGKQRSDDRFLDLARRNMEILRVLKERGINIESVKEGVRKNIIKSREGKL